ncbi:MAG: hypothetical protein COB38_05240 [Gammaproteobacteria bacterium]|nr:MAG: hypothetical protein COB38_05240 [Gammaproteobacteria bacterium]
MKNLKLLEWVQLGLMISLVVLVMSFLVELKSPSDIFIKLESGYKYYFSIYSHSVDPVYVSALCLHEQSILLLRIDSLNSEVISKNNLIDIFVFLTLLLGGCLSWILYTFRFIRKITFYFRA